MHGTTPHPLHYVGDGMEMLHVPRWGDDAVGDIDIPIQPVDSALERGLVYWQILGMEDCPNRLCGDSLPGVELEDPAELLGPVVLVRHDIRDEATRPAHPL